MPLPIYEYICCNRGSDMCYKYYDRTAYIAYRIEVQHQHSITSHPQITLSSYYDAVAAQISIYAT